jgi:hypothetical protein
MKKTGATTLFTKLDGICLYASELFDSTNCANAMK